MRIWNGDQSSSTLNLPITRSNPGNGQKGRGMVSLEVSGEFCVQKGNIFVNF